MSAIVRNEKSMLLLSGVVGLIAAILVGSGEFLLHYDPLARFSGDGYAFMQAASNGRQTLGHFTAVLATPFYVVGCWHIYLMLKPAGQWLALVAFLLAAYGFVVGAVWIGSRSSIGALVHLQDSNLAVQGLIELYQQRYETLLWVIRGTTLILSLILIVLTLSGRSYYPKWMALCNPIVLLLLNFVVFVISPAIGKYLMPVALNIGFGVFFLLSLLQARKI